MTSPATSERVKAAVAALEDATSITELDRARRRMWSFLAEMYGMWRQARNDFRKINSAYHKRHRALRDK